MNYTPKKIKRVLKNCINELSNTPKLFAKNPAKDFSRTRKLPFKQMLKIVCKACRCVRVSRASLGHVTMINDHLYEGRFTPRVDGKRISRNIYAQTREGLTENKPSAPQYLRCGRQRKQIISREFLFSLRQILPGLEFLHRARLSFCLEHQFVLHKIIALFYLNCLNEFL